jgi:hypothetical protein
MQIHYLNLSEYKLSEIKMWFLQGVLKYVVLRTQMVLFMEKAKAEDAIKVMFNRV